MCCSYRSCAFLPFSEWDLKNASNQFITSPVFRFSIGVVHRLTDSSELAITVAVRVFYVLFGVFWSLELDIGACHINPTGWYAHPPIQVKMDDLELFCLALMVELSLNRGSQLKLFVSLFLSTQWKLFIFTFFKVKLHFVVVCEVIVEVSHSTSSSRDLILSHWLGSTSL